VWPWHGNVENSHRTNRDTFGTRHTDIASSDSLSAERRHRNNQRASEKHRQGFPKVGHSDTWLIDHEQILVDKNHNTILYPTWSNPACYYLYTPERFQTVPLHSEALDTAINNLNIPTAVRDKFSLDQKYLCHVMKKIAPILPIHRQAGRENGKIDGNTQCCKRCLLYLGDKSDMCRGRVPFWAKKEDGCQYYRMNGTQIRWH
jgi:hypothetical protein